MHSHSRVGRILPDIASQLGLPDDCEVLCGGNDAVLAALAAGLTDPGAASAVHGTCDVSCVCVDAPVRSRNFNVRCHVVPGRWLAFFVLNTGGKALEWFHSVFCSEMTEDEFFDDYVPTVLASFLDDPELDSQDDRLPEFVPYLQGSRYSLEQLTASYSGLTLQTTRETMLLGLLKGNLKYTGEHLKEVSAFVKLRREMATTGGAARIPRFMEAKKRWTGDFDFRFLDQSSLAGAAMLGVMHQRETAGA
jgi:sugar (pentulose or hexulose) kinase